MSVDSACAICSVSSIDELCDDYVGGRSTGGEEEGDKDEPKPVLSVTEVHTILTKVLRCCFMRTALASVMNSTL